MQGMRLSVEGLQGSLQRVRGEVTDLCSRVRLLCTQAQNLHAAADVLRAVLLRLKLVARLRACHPSGAQTCSLQWKQSHTGKSTRRNV